MVLRIEHDAKGRASGVVYADAQCNIQLQKAHMQAWGGSSNTVEPAHGLGHLRAFA